MKLFKKLLGVVGVTGALVASAPASATLTMQFLDGLGNNIGFAQRNGVSLTFLGQVNGWNVLGNLGQSDNPEFGLKLTVSAYHRTTADANFDPAPANNFLQCAPAISCLVNSTAPLVIGNLNSGGVGSVEQSILKIRFNDNAMPAISGSQYQILQTLSTAAQYQRTYNTFIEASPPATQLPSIGITIGLPGAQSYNDLQLFTPSANLISLTAGVDLILDALTGTNMNPNQPFFFTYQITAVPEPGTIALLGLGLIGVAVGGKRRRAKASA